MVKMLSLVKNRELGKNRNVLSRWYSYFFVPLQPEKAYFVLSFVKDGMPESHCFDNIQINI